ncbi:MAG: dienelactone hydrolase family protein [Gemmataceae bacterium]|nr:dienelactone hydrolase family protein [Gemmataceae bacterium]
MCIDSGYQADSVDRRDFVVEGAAALITMGVLGPAAFAQDQKQSPTRVLDDPTIRHGKVVFQHNGQDTIDGYLARPKAEGLYPAVLVIAGNLITEEYIPNTCAALALAGFVGLAPNIFHPIPEGTPRNNAAFAKYIAKHTELDLLDDVQLGASYLRAQPFVDSGGMGVVGFCMGGRLAMLLGARSREVDAVVAYHPAPMREKELVRLTIPVQVHHGTADRAVSHTNTQELEKMLRARKTPVEVFLYEKLDHGFLAYTRPFYDPDAAQLAWKRTVTFLNQYLKR